MPPILVIDTAHLFYPLLFRMPGLSNDEQETGILFGLTKYVIQLADKFETNQMVFTFDSRKNFRKKLFPEYKIKRRQQERTEEEQEIFRKSFIQLNQFRMDALPALGFTNIYQETGLESDDIIASIVQSNQGEFIIVSNDEDLWQLLRDNVSIYNTKTGNVYTKKDFVQEWGIQPEQWADVKKIAGCVSDEVPGIMGVGPKTVCKYLQGELKEKSKKYQDIVSKEGKEIAVRNEPLVKLPFQGTPVYKINHKWKLNLTDFIYVCEDYKFNSLMYGSGFDKWKNIMCGG